MPEPPAEPKLRADARRNREKVLVAARDVFAETGYDAPLDDIAARAGVGAGTVYRPLPAKEAPFQAGLTPRVGDPGAAAPDEPGPAFFGFLDRVAAEASAKRDLPDAIAISGALQDAMHACLAQLLDQAQA